MPTSRRARLFHVLMQFLLVALEARVFKLISARQLDCWQSQRLAPPLAMAILDRAPKLHLSQCKADMPKAAGELAPTLHRALGQPVQPRIRVCKRRDKPSRLMLGQLRQLLSGATTLSLLMTNQ